MVQFNFSERTIKAKVVYYGPAQSGKTTNLEQIHRLTDPGGTNRLISLNTAQDRTLFFDLLPFSLGAVSGYDFKIQLYTVPGQVQYNATRRVVLAGADAVVFVADSRRSLIKENVQAFENMKVNLLANRLVPEKIPFALQFNKRDLPDALSEAELNKSLNPWQRPNFAAVAVEGRGVIETFVAIIEQTLVAIALRYNLKEKGLDPARVPELVAGAFASLMQAAPPAAAGGPPTPARLVLSQPSEGAFSAMPASPDGGVVSEDLLQRAIRSNVELAEVLGDLAREMTDGLAAILGQVDSMGAAVAGSGQAQSIRKEAERMRQVVQKLGRAGGVDLPQPAPAPARQPTPAAPSAASGGQLGIEGPLRDAITGIEPQLKARGLAVDIRVSPGTPLPVCGSQDVQRVIGGVMQAVAASATPGTTVLRCEKKPVLLRSSTGEVRREFVMCALAQLGGLTDAQQQQVLQGSDPGPMGAAYRLVREKGGFLRFAPLPNGGLETRVFLPVA
jgi:mutual gliding-motility protein MglA